MKSNELLVKDIAEAIRRITAYLNGRSVDLYIVWKTVVSDIPQLGEAMAVLLEPVKICDERLSHGESD
ncbi:MAG: hypothetical protein ACYCYO_21105 [Bacilli bacterium]